MSPHNGRSPVAKTLRVSVIMLNLLLTGTRMGVGVSVAFTDVTSAVFIRTSCGASS